MTDTFDLVEIHRHTGDATAIGDVRHDPVLLSLICGAAIVELRPCGQTPFHRRELDACTAALERNDLIVHAMYIDQGDRLLRLTRSVRESAAHRGHGRKRI